MVATTFDRDEMARFYAQRRIKIDPFVERILYLRQHEAKNEICLIEVNSALPDGIYQPEAVEFGIDHGSENEHTLLVLDVSPNDWQQLQDDKLPLPDGWTLDGLEVITRRRS